MNTRPEHLDPPCRWRRELLTEGRYRCRSTKLHAPAGVSLPTCAGCYCRDHEPEEPAPAPADPPPKRTFAQRAAAFLAAMKDEAAWRAGGGAGPSAEERAARRAACDACEHRDAEHDGCSLCGCYLEPGLLPPRPFGKLDCATQACPDNPRRWGFAGGYEPPKDQPRRCCGGG